MKRLYPWGLLGVLGLLGLLGLSQHSAGFYGFFGMFGFLGLALRRTDERLTVIYARAGLNGFFTAVFTLVLVICLIGFGPSPDVLAKAVGASLGCTVVVFAVSVLYFEARGV